MKRIPFSLVGFVLVMFAACVPQLLASKDNFFPPSRPGPEWLIMPGCCSLLRLSSVLAVRILTRWSIGNTRRIEGPASPVNQFSIKYLLVLTAVCAVLLGIGRALAIDWSFDSNWRNLGRMVVRVWMILFVMVPAILVPLTVISFRPTLRMFLGTIISGAVLAWVAIETIILLNNPPRREVTPEVLFIQLGGVLASIASSLVLRVCRISPGQAALRRRCS